MFVSIGDLRSQDPTILIHANVKFLPMFAPPFPMFLGMPFSLATDLQTRTVHDKVHRAVRQAPGASTRRLSFDSGGIRSCDLGRADTNPSVLGWI